MTSTRVARILHEPYARVIVPDDQGRYAAQVLEFPGCFAEGETPEEAYANLESAAESWVESALAQGIPVPQPFASQGYSGTVSLRLPKSLHRRAAQHAHRDGVSLNQFLVAAIAAQVGAEDLVATVAARLDDRIDALASRRFLIMGVAEEIAATSQGRIPPVVPADLPKLQSESATLPRTEPFKLVHRLED